MLASVAVPVPDPIKGYKPVAFVLLHPGAAFDEDELKQHVLGHLQPFARPRAVWALDQLPLAATNRVDRRELIRIALERL